MSVAIYLGFRSFQYKKVKKWPQDQYFSQKVLLVGTPILTIKTCFLECRHLGRHMGRQIFPLRASRTFKLLIVPVITPLRP